MSKNEITIKTVNDMPIIIPEKMDKKALFNSVQDTQPISDLVGKKFAIVGLIPEMVDVPKTRGSNGDEIHYEEGEDVEMVNRLRITLITNIGSFHSFSVTFNSALMKMLNLFGVEYKEMEFEIISKSRGTGKDIKAYYVIKAI